jgi:hypothetical protein
MDRGLRFVSTPHDRLTSLWLKEEEEDLEAVIQRSLQTPAVTPETKGCRCVLADSRNYYIKDLRKIRKRIPFIIQRFQPSYTTALTL